MENGSKARPTKEHILGDQRLVPSRTVSPRYQVPEEMPAERPCDLLAYLHLVRADRTFRAPGPELYKIPLNDEKTNILAIKCLQHLFSHGPRRLISYFTTEKVWQTLMVYEPKRIWQERH